MNDTLDKRSIFNPKIIKRGIILFIAITVMAFAAIFFYNDGAKSLKTWQEVNPEYLLLGIFFIFNDLYLGGLRNHIFVRQFVPGISQWVSIKANLANIFMGAVTPFQSGGGPAQWYIFYRSGVSLPDMVGTSFYNWISTLLFFPISGAFAVFILKNNIPPGFITHLTTFGFSIFTTLLIVIMLGLFAPKVIYLIIEVVARFIGVIRKSWQNKVTDLGTNGIHQLGGYREKYLGLVVRKPWLMLFSFLLTIVLYFNKYALAYVFIAAFGIEADFGSVIAVMAVSYLLLYFAPSPGGSGIAELGITALLVPIIGSEIAPSITLLHRSFLVFIPAILGSIVVLNQLSKEDSI